MRSIILISAAILAFAPFAAAQSKQRTKRKPTPTPEVEDMVVKNGGSIDGKTYSNAALHLAFTLPNDWYFAGRDFEAALRKQGIDLSVSENERTKVLFTAFRSTPESKTSAVIRFVTEDIADQPQIRDAVDYLDAVRNAYQTMRVPVDLKYGETDAEAIGGRQFAFLDIETRSAKKRMYVRLYKRSAVIMVISYREAEDLARFRRMLEDADFGTP